MDFKSHLERSFKLTMEYIVPLVLITFVMAIVGFFSLGILMPVMAAGYTQSMLMIVRSGREPKVQDIFSEMRLFLPLLIFGVIVFIVLMLGFSLLFFPGFLLSFAVAYLCLYMIPLMTDRSYDLVDAIKESYRMVGGPDKIDHIIVAILFVGINMIGGSLFIGFLFTQPLATLFLVSVYEEKIHGTRPPAPPTGNAPQADDAGNAREGEVVDEEVVIKHKV